MRKKAVGLTQAPQIPSDRGDIFWDENGRLLTNDPELAAQVRAFCNIAPDEAGTVRAQIRFSGSSDKAGQNGDRIFPDDSDMVVDVRC